MSRAARIFTGCFMLFLAVTLLITGTAAAGNITFEGVPADGSAWAYADSNLTIPVNISGFTTGLSAFALVIDVTGASADENLRPTYNCTSDMSWCAVLNEKNSTISAASPDAQNITRYVLTGSGVPVNVGNESFRIGTLTLSLENITDGISYITIRAYMPEAYDKSNISVSGDSGNITIGFRPYPQHIVYYNYDTGELLDRLISLPENKTYGNISACIYASNCTQNLYNAAFGDSILWEAESGESGNDVAVFADAHANPVLISGSHAGTVYLHTVTSFPEPTVAFTAVNPANQERFGESWAGYDNYTQKVQTGASLEYLYVLEIPADFNLKENKAVQKKVEVKDFVIPDDKQLNVYVSSEQYDAAGNTYCMYYINNPTVKANYNIMVDGKTITENNYQILSANASDADTGVSANLSFSMNGHPDQAGTYRGQLTFYVDFTDVSAPELTSLSAPLPEAENESGPEEGLYTSTS